VAVKKLKWERETSGRTYLMTDDPQEDVLAGIGGDYLNWIYLGRQKYFLRREIQQSDVEQIALEML
jgi:hypothetical protein